MTDRRFDQLSPRQRDCLRLAHRRLTSKEIARELGIGPGTVKSYCSEAIAILGAVDRRHAAALLAAHEAPTDGPLPPGGVADPGDGETPDAPGRPMHPLGPLSPANRGADNELGITSRIAWIVALAIGIAIAFGAVAAGVRTVSDLIAGHQRGAR